MKVLFIGNSHTYFNDMPMLFASMCEELTGDAPDVAMLAYSGRSLNWHCREFFSVRFALLYGGFDYCVIQQQAHPMPEEAETRTGFSELIALCDRCRTKPVVFMTWAEKANRGNAERMSALYRSIADEHGALLAPVGENFERVLCERPDIELYWHDGEHASPYGDYLAACTIAHAVLPDADITVLSDRGIDFCAKLNKNGLPCASLEAEKLGCNLDAEKALALRLCAAGNA